MSGLKGMRYSRTTGCGEEEDVSCRSRAPRARRERERRVRISRAVRTGWVPWGVSLGLIRSVRRNQPCEGGWGRGAGVLLLLLLLLSLSLLLLLARGGGGGEEEEEEEGEGAGNPSSRSSRSDSGIRPVMQAVRPAEMRVRV